MMSRTSLSILLCCALSLIGLSGCTNKMNSVNDTVVALYGNYQDVELSQKEISELPYPSAYVRLNDGRQIFMVLAFADTNPETGGTRLSWISSDNALIITEQGRIIKTVALDGDNLVSISSDHVVSPVHTLQAWQGQYHWMPDYRFSFGVTVAASYVGDEHIESSQWQLNTKHYQERVTLTALDKSFVNQYWVASDKQVVKTIQYIGLNMTKIEMTFLKTYAAN